MACVCVHTHVCLKRSEEGSRSPGAGVTDECEPLDMGTGIELRSSGRAKTLLTAEPPFMPSWNFLTRRQCGITSSITGYRPGCS